MQRARCAALVGVFVPLILLAGRDLPAADPGNYLGYRECAACHEPIVKDWLRTRHAQALESLKKTSQEGLPGCLRCHVTGYEKPGGYVDGEITPELAGVQCEECHGPGQAHAREPGEKGRILAKPGEQRCRPCHTPGQDPGFDYGKRVQSVHSK